MPEIGDTTTTWLFEEPFDDSLDRDDLLSQVKSGLGLAAAPELGRYIVLERIGAGGMGVVYAAYDPDLDRRVAIKVLRSGFARRDPAAARRRLRHEAQILARVTHPNVLGILDVGISAGGDERAEGSGTLYLVTELVEGVDLRTWHRTRARSWREVVAMYLQVARGLTAAHAGGVVHGDFKPANALVGPDGRVRIGDFGLAVANAPPGPEHPVACAEKRGAVSGTPAYMAPEQHCGEVAAPASDVFAFGVGLFEAVYGRLPFAGRTLDELAEAKSRPPALPRRPVLPRGLRQILLAMLAEAPEQRPAGFESIATALEHAKRRPSKALWSVAASACAGVAWSLASASAEPCTKTVGEIEGVWNDDARTTIARAFVEQGSEYAADTWSRAASRIDAHVAAWSETRRTVCEAGRTRDLDRDFVERRRACLDDQLRALQALITVYGSPDPEVIAHAITAASDLPDAARCDDPARFRGRAPERTHGTKALDGDRELLALARAHGRTGRYRAALEESEEVLTRIRATDSSPLLTEALLVHGIANKRMGRIDDAIRDSEDAYFAAIGTGEVGVAFDAATELAYLVGYQKADIDGGDAWLRHARALSSHTGDDPEARIDIVTAEGHIAHRAGRLRESLASHRAALALGQQHLMHGDPMIADALRNIGGVLAQLGENDEAIATMRHLLALQTESHGDEHPLVALDHNNLGFVFFSCGRLDESLAEHRIALRIRERTLPAEHPDIAESTLNVGTTLLTQGDLEGARPLLERARDVYVAARGPHHPDVALAWENLAVLADHEGHALDAVQLNERAMEALEGSIGPDSLEGAAIFHNLGTALDQLGRRDEARDALRRALAIRLQIQGARHGDVGRTGLLLARTIVDAASRVDLLRRARVALVAAHGDIHPLVGETWLELGEAHLEQGEPAEALPAFERALVVLGRNASPVHDIARAEFGLARTARALGDERGARAAARRARGLYRDREAAESTTVEVAAIDVFLRAR